MDKHKWMKTLHNQSRQQQTGDDNDANTTTSQNPLAYNKNEGLKDTKWRQDIGCIHIRVATKPSKN